MRIRNLIFKIPVKFYFLKIPNLIKFYLFKSFITNKVYYRPLTMDIEPTTGCNFRCTMCQVSSPGFEARNMTIETFRTLVENNLQLIKVKLQGMGEPFVNKHLFEMMNICYEKGIFVETVTNGSLLTKENIEKITETKSIYRISISIDGASKEIFEKIRVKSNFENVINNIKNLSFEIKEKKAKINLRALCLLQKTNLHQFEKIIKLCIELGFDELEFQVQLTGWGKSEWEEKNTSSDIGYRKLDNKQKFQDIIDIYNKKYFKVSIVKSNLLSKENKCSYPWHNPYISAEGKVVVCCMVADPKINTMGDINKESFDEIWNSENYINFRDSITNHKLKDFCKNCYKNN